MEPTPDEQVQPHLSRRTAMRWGATAALATWAVPTVVTWAPSPAHAGTPSPGDEEVEEVEAARGPAPSVGGPDRELAETGTNLGLLAAAGVTTIVGGATVLRLRDTWSDRSTAAGTALPLPPRPEPPSGN